MREERERSSSMVICTGGWSSSLRFLCSLEHISLFPNAHLRTHLILGSLQCHSELAIFALNSLFVPLKVPSSTSKSEIMLLISVAHPFRFSHTYLRPANVCLISPWPVLRLVISPVISLTFPLDHSIQGGGITSRYGWGVQVSISLEEIFSSCF